MTAWHLSEAGARDLADVARLVNSAYRGDAARRGWTHEADLLGGQRTDPGSLARDLAGPDRSALLCLREHDGGPLLACAFVEVTAGGEGDRTCYVGMVTVEPSAQNRGLGRAMLDRAEGFARTAGCGKAVMTVISAREELIAWYGRRGYAPTGETRPFPYGDERFGVPRRDDLRFVVLEKALA